MKYRLSQKRTCNLTNLMTFSEDLLLEAGLPIVEIYSLFLFFFELLKVYVITNSFGFYPQQPFSNLIPSLRLIEVVSFRELEPGFLNFVVFSYSLSSSFHPQPLHFLKFIIFKSTPQSHAHPLQLSYNLIPSPLLNTLNS